MDGLPFLPAGELARAIRERRVGSVEATRRLLERIAGPGRSLNAVVTLDAERALEHAARADAALERGESVGPLHGVPVTIKESFDVAGVRATAGWRRLADRVATWDATVVARLRAAGAIVLGKTNVPPLAGDWQTDNPIFGATPNPWDPGRTPGGSSGGGAAAVAAGLSPLDVGSDVGGSLRVPAAFCGVVTLKPTEWRVSGAGHVPDDGIPGTGGHAGLLRHMSVYGPLARAVPDLGLAMSALVGADPRQPGVPPVPWRAAPRVEPRSLRIVASGSLPGAPVTRESASIVDRFVETLARGGVGIARVDARELDIERAWEGWGVIAGTEAAAIGSPETERVDPGQVDAVVDSPMERGFYRGLLGSTEPYFEALAFRAAFIRAVDAVLAESDAWLLPATGGPAFPPRRDGAPVEADGSEIRYVDYVAGHAAPFSFSGHPAVVLPAGLTAAGLPVGVQLVGRRFGDEALLEAAAAVEALTGGFAPPPAFSEAREPA